MSRDRGHAPEQVAAAGRPHSEQAGKGYSHQAPSGRSEPVPRAEQAVLHHRNHLVLKDFQEFPGASPEIRALLPHIRGWPGCEIVVPIHSENRHQGRGTALAEIFQASHNLYRLKQVHHSPDRLVRIAAVYLLRACGFGEMSHTDNKYNRYFCNMELYEHARPGLLAGKKLLYVHGFASSGQTGSVRTLRLLLPDADIIAPMFQSSLTKPSPSLKKP